MKPSPIRLLIFCATWLGAITALADDRPPLPAKKMPAELPASAAWEITFKYNDEPAKAAGATETGASPAADGAAAETEPRPVKMVVTRTGDTIREETSWSVGKKTEKWILRKNLQVIEDLTTGRLFRLPATTLIDDFSDYSKGSFSELAWISPEHYQGVRKVNERPCFIFTAACGQAVGQLAAELNPEIPAELRGTATDDVKLDVAIDTATLLPVFFNNGRVMKSYRILPPPTSQLVMPPKFAEAFDEWIKRIEEANRRPGKP
jgi:hypothetical protein